MARVNIPRTRRVIKKILDGKLFKQIAYEEGVQIRAVVLTKKNYIRQRLVLELNAKGQRIMSEGAGQLTLTLIRKTDLRVDHRKK